jgi:hypothetical protein
VILDRPRIASIHREKGGGQWTSSAPNALGEVLEADRVADCYLDLTGELRAWPQDSWQQVGVDPDQVAQAVVGCWQDGEVTGLQVDDLSFEEARSLTARR